MPIKLNVPHENPTEVSLSKSPLSLTELRFVVQCFEFFVVEEVFAQDLLGDNQLTKALNALDHVIYRAFEEEEEDDNSQYTDSELLTFRRMCGKYFESIKNHMEDGQEALSASFSGIKKEHEAGLLGDSGLNLSDAVESIWVDFFVIVALKTLNRVTVKIDEDENILLVRIEKEADFWEYTFSVMPILNSEPNLPIKVVMNHHVVTDDINSNDHDFLATIFLAMLSSIVLMDLSNRGEIGKACDKKSSSLTINSATIQ